MKRYMVFAGSWYYPDGGWKDFIGAVDTIEEGVEKAKSWDYRDWWTIVDSSNGQIVKEFPAQ